jgi:hypothetical protein
MARRWLIVLLWPAVAMADADTQRAIAKLENALPSGWSVLATDSELVIRHDRPVYLTGEHHENAAPNEKKAPGGGGGPLITLQLRYRLEPKWTDKQIADAKATNASLGADLRAASAKYKIDAIKLSKGRPLPANPDEQARLDAYEKERSQITTRMIKLPTCTLGDASLFDGEDTYSQLMLEVDPPSAMREAQKVVTLVKQSCHT